MDMARHLVSGCDVWLNNPIRPHEASGTSGQKASLNGLPNCSIRRRLVGRRLERQTMAGLLASDATIKTTKRVTRPMRALYDILEQAVVPLYFEAGLDGVPHNWIVVMKEAIRTIAPAFSMRRMVKEYVNELYGPRFSVVASWMPTTTALAKKLAAWKREIRAKWADVNLEVVRSS